MNDVTGMPQTMVVLGGGSDIAGALLRDLAGRRLRAVLLVGRSESNLQPMADELTNLGVGSVTVREIDVTDVAANAKLAGEAAEILGSIDLVLVAAGVLGTSAIDGIDPAGVADDLTVNFTGPAAAIVAYAEVMRRQGFGRIVVLSSVAGIRVRRANFVYGSAKAGLDGFALGLGDALVGTGVHLTIVRPGFVHSKMTAGLPKAPLATTPEAVASQIVRGLETKSEMIWSPSPLRFVFAIMQLLPRSLWRRMPR